MSMHSARIICLACMVVILSGCATWTVPTDSGDTLLRARAVTEAGRGVEVSATVLGPEDSIRMLGTDVNAAGVQPVWIEVRNDTEHMLWLLRAGADPDYFSPLEVAWSAHVKLARETNARIDEHFSRLAFPNPIPAHGTSSGILYTNPQPVVKLLTVDLLGSKMMIPFTLFLPVPGDIASAQAVIHQYADTEISNYDDLDPCMARSRACLVARRRMTAAWLASRSMSCSSAIPMTSLPPSTGVVIGEASQERTRHSWCLVDRRT